MLTGCVRQEHGRVLRRLLDKLCALSGGLTHTFARIKLSYNHLYQSALNCNARHSVELKEVRGEQKAAVSIKKDERIE